MKNLVLRSIALIAIGVSIPAFASDMPVKAPPPSAPAAQAGKVANELDEPVFQHF